MDDRINIVSTKKLSERQKHLLSKASILLTEEEFIQIKIKNFELPKINQNLIFTSQNAVQSVLENTKINELKSHPVFCVGMKTKELLEKNGFKVVVDADYASDLSEIIALVHSNESFTFFSGNLRRDILPKTLTENSIAFNEIEVYQTSITSHKIKTKPNGILFFSPSGVESYLKTNTIKAEVCFCIGETTAETLENNNIQRIIIAGEPSIDHVIQDAIEYFTT